MLAKKGASHMRKAGSLSLLVVVAAAVLLAASSTADARYIFADDWTDPGLGDAGTGGSGPAGLDPLVGDDEFNQIAMTVSNYVAPPKTAIIRFWWNADSGDNSLPWRHDGPDGEAKLKLWVDGTFAGIDVSVVSYNGGTAVLWSETKSISGTTLDNISVPIEFDFGAIATGTVITDVDVSFHFNVGGSEGINIEAVSNPEPSTLALFGGGLLGLAAWTWRRRRKKKAAEA
jgi:hypothetical protein